MVMDVYGEIMRWLNHLTLALMITINVSACGNASVHLQSSDLIDVSGLSSGQCHLRVTGSGSLEETTAGHLRMHTTGGRILQVTSTKREHHFTAVVAYLPAASVPGKYELANLDASATLENITDYRVSINQTHQGNDIAVYPVTSGTIAWQANPLRVKLAFVADKQGKTMQIQVICNDVEEDGTR
jgi:hypothetical protein